METNIQKWGNSLAVRLPKSIAEKQSFTEGGRVVVRETNTGILLEIVKKPKRTLRDLLKDVSKENLQQEVDWGKKMGTEVW